MRKTGAPARDSDSASLRSIPSVERLLSDSAFQALIAPYGRDRVKEALTAHLAELRARRVEFDAERALAAVRATAAGATRTSLAPVINGTGVIIHTNLGRSPIGTETWESAASLVCRYANLEFDLRSGERGSRDEHLTSLCRTLFGCEAALLTNNNAAATLLLLAAVAADREVIVSRGELVEIGGGFRVPEIIQQGGARLREVGTTNRTRIGDYADAVNERTAAILRVHRSNFEIVGFTESPSIADLVDLARARKVPLLFDEGSGRVVDLSPYGFHAQPTLAQLIAAEVDVVTCSTDKLIGATQGGLILGKREIVEKCRRHPLLRAMRAGKESYAIVGATLQAFATGSYRSRIPLYRMLDVTVEELRRRAEDLVSGTGCTVRQSGCALGGGTTPAETISSVAIELPGPAHRAYERLLANDPPIVGRITEDRCTLDLRTMLEEDLPAVAKALRAIEQ
ncbi:MAG TPA: L-seryl-tRNA(Sec) selenium transferase [Thermoanaerobaculia bacterium]|nr:L-seryl-tRNA(Sec) selenium transferase [Thermoanaerobaculia bacterium]